MTKRLATLLLIVAALYWARGALAMSPHFAPSSYGQLFEENAAGTTIAIGTGGDWYEWVSSEDGI